MTLLTILLLAYGNWEAQLSEEVGGAVEANRKNTSSGFGGAAHRGQPPAAKGRV